MKLIGERTLIIQHRGSLVTLGVVLLLYGLISILTPKDVFWSPDEGIRLMMAHSRLGTSVETRDLVYPGARLDPALQFYPSVFNSERITYPRPRSDGSVRFPWPIWFPLVSGWILNISNIRGLYVIPLMSSWLTALVSGRLAAQFEPSLAPWAILLVGLGTPIFFYSQLFWELTFVALLAALALWVSDRRQPVEPLLLLIGVFLLIIAVLLRIEMLAFLLAFGLAWLVMLIFRQFKPGSSGRSAIARHPPEARNRLVKALVYVGLGLVIVFLLSKTTTWILPRHQAEFHHWVRWVERLLTPGRFWVRFQFAASRMVGNIPRLAINFPGEEGVLIPEIWGWIGLCAVLGIALSAWVRSWQWEIPLLLPSLWVLIALTGVAVFTTQSYRALHGFFIAAPALAMCFYCLPTAWREQNARLLRLSLTCVFYLIIVTLVVLRVRGGRAAGFMPGLEWGPRYMIAIYAPMGVLSLLAVKSYWDSQRPAFIRRLVVGSVIIMMGLGLLIQVRGIWMVQQTKQPLVVWQSWMEKVETEPIVTDVWWLPASLANYFVGHQVFSVADLEALADWLELAEQEQLDSFTYVGLSQLPRAVLPQDQFYLENATNVSGLHFLNFRKK